MNQVQMVHKLYCITLKVCNITTTRTKDITSSKITMHYLLRLQMLHTLTFTDIYIIYASKVKQACITKMPESY